MSVITIDVHRHVLHLIARYDEQHQRMPTRLRMSYELYFRVMAAGMPLIEPMRGPESGWTLCGLPFVKDRSILVGFEVDCGEVPPVK